MATKMALLLAALLVVAGCCECPPPKDGPPSLEELRAEFWRNRNLQSDGAKPCNQTKGGCDAES